MKTTARTHKLVSGHQADQWRDIVGEEDYIKILHALASSKYAWVFTSQSEIEALYNLEFSDKEKQEIRDAFEKKSLDYLLWFTTPPYAFGGCSTKWSH